MWVGWLVGWLVDWLVFMAPLLVLMPKLVIFASSYKVSGN